MRLRSKHKSPPSQTIPPVRHSFYSTTHEAVRIPELLLRYFGHLSRAELVNSAIVCRSWSAQALDTLWRHHEVPLSVLLGQLPFLYEKLFERPEDGPGYALEDGGLIRSSWHPLMEQSSPELIDASAWNPVLYKYAHKIIHLFVDTTLGEDSINLLAALFNETASPALCPNSQSLRFSMGPYQNSETLHSKAIPALCGSSVTSIELNNHPGGEHNPIDIAGHLGMALKTCGNQIQRFVLRSPACNNYYSMFTPDFSLFDHLTEVHLRSLSLAGWRKLANNCLHLLEVYLTERPCEPRGDEFTGDPTRSIDFPLLRKLSIDCGYLNNGVLVESNMPALESLTVSKSVFDRDQVISKQIANRSGLLQEIEFCIMQYLGGVGSIITTLSSLCHLRKLKLTGETSRWDVTDGDMDVLARSVLNLQSISITLKQTLSYRKDRVPLTHATLISLVQYCRQLNSIELPMDLSRADDSKEKPVDFGPSTTVTSLTFSKILLPSKFGDDDSPRTSQVELVDGVVRFLVGCCPEVRVFKVREQDEPRGFRRVSSIAQPCIEERFRKYFKDRKWRVISVFVDLMRA
ncbi:hypothetical protein FRB93_003027 [Tulasnella sp. JGI-2019a]|nr:hypothetical protein FRB93_003027 [Tulasnella sp. JGI-2019a]